MSDLSELAITKQFLVEANKVGSLGHIKYSFDIFEEINAHQLPLAHVIYVERNELGTFGLVQFFGVFQFICKLGR